jgi:hypothetical protein
MAPPARSGRRHLLRKVDQICHDDAACSRDTGWVLLRTIGGALVQPVRQSGAGPERREKAREVVAALPAWARYCVRTGSPFKKLAKQPATNP